MTDKRQARRDRRALKKMYERMPWDWPGWLTDGRPDHLHGKIILRDDTEHEFIAYRTRERDEHGFVIYDAPLPYAWGPGHLLPPKGIMIETLPGLSTVHFDARLNMPPLLRWRRVRARGRTA